MAFFGANLSARERRVQQRDHLKHGMGWDPLVILPHEIALMCLQEALPATSSHNYPPALIDLTSVSQKWQNFIFSTPVLWNTIHIKYSTHDLLFIVALFTHLSYPSPLKVIVWNEPGPEWETVRAILQRHTDRILRLTLGDNPPIYSDSIFKDAGYASLATNMIKSLGYLPSFTELDFGRDLKFEPLQLKELDLPLNARIMSPIQVSLQDSAFGHLYLTSLTSEGTAKSIFADELIFSNFMREKQLNLMPNDDCTVLALNSNISTLIHIFKFLDSSTASISGLMNSPCAAFIGASSGDRCLLCRSPRDAPGRAFGCIRSHFGLRPFQCPGCGLCNAANGFTTSYLLRNHIGPTTCAICGTQAAARWVETNGEALCGGCLKSPNELFEIARAAEVLGNLKRAQEAYETVIAIDPLSWRALTQAAHVCHLREDYPQAVEYFNAAIQIDEKNGDIWASLGYCQLMQDDLRSAYDAYQNSLLHSPGAVESAPLWYNIGALYQRFHSLQYAEEAFSHVLKIDPNFERTGDVIFQLGIISRQLQQYSRSLVWFDRVRAKPPHPLSPIDIISEIGCIFEQQGNYEGARDTWEGILLDEPNHAKTLQRLGWLYQQSTTTFHNQEVAVQCLRQSVLMDSYDAMSWYLFGRVFASSQKYKKAYECYQQAVYRDRRNPILWNSVGILYFHLGQFKDALDSFQRAIRTNPYIHVVWFNLGSLYETCNQQHADAHYAYIRAGEVDPTDVTVKERAGLLARYFQDSSIPLGAPPLPVEVNPMAYPNSKARPPDQPPRMQLPPESLHQPPVRRVFNGAGPPMPPSIPFRPVHDSRLKFVPPD